MSEKTVLKCTHGSNSLTHFVMTHRSNINCRLHLGKEYNPQVEVGHQMGTMSLINCSRCVSISMWKVSMHNIQVLTVQSKLPQILPNSTRSCRTDSNHGYGASRVSSITSTTWHYHHYYHRFRIQCLRPRLANQIAEGLVCHHHSIH